MSTKVPRRDFIKALPVAAAAMGEAAKAFARPGAGTSPGGAALAIQTFDYRGVKLLPSRWQKQYQAAGDFWLGLPEDDILHGYRQAAGLTAPGKPLGGWCARNSNTVLGQWLSGMARMHRATGDAAVRDKAIRIFSEWAKTVKPDGDCGMRHYPFEKLVCGLIDMKHYGDCDEAGVMLERVIDWASKSLSHENVPATPRRGSYAGTPGEWYTLAENPYRAYQITGNPKYKAFGDLWLYNSYWGKFANSSTPENAQGVHAYSHINTFSSAAMAYAVTEDKKYLNIIKNAYDWLQNSQCYATGGFGPSEFITAMDGGIGRALETRQDSFETACGSWAAFKLGRYLMSFTGEARYGDWIERILYNGIGAALPVTSDGKNFYYSDYRVQGGMKVYNWEMWTCCSGSYIQAVADYHNIIYFKDAKDLYVNLYVPSELTWRRADGELRVTQEATYPEGETSTLTVDVRDGTEFAIKLRVPEWSIGMSVKVNGADAKVDCKPGTWASVQRKWNRGDKVEVKIPLSVRMQAVDKEHPDRVALVRGPVAMVLETAYHDPFFWLPGKDEELNKWLVPDAGPTAQPGFFTIKPTDGSAVRSKLRPFYSTEENYPYKIYFDKKLLPIGFW
jgi:DUF1680 family protein